MNYAAGEGNHELAKRLVSEQNFLAAVVAGAVATCLAAAAYGITVAVWEFSYGFAAAAVGIVVGLSMQFLGRGISTRFSVAAAVYTIAGCVLGNLFRVVFALARSGMTSPLDVIRNNSLAVLAERSVSYMSLIDLVYWFVAVVFAVFLVKRPLSRSARLAIARFDSSAERDIIKY